MWIAPQVGFSLSVIPLLEDFNMIFARFWPLALTGLITTLPLTKALNILLTNDDSWASANIR